jgi:hypothetical protein
VIGHLVAWSDHLLDEAEALARGNAEAIQAVDIDAWNAAQVAARRDWPVEQVRAAWERTVRRALRVAARLSADEMVYRWRVPWTDEPVSPADLLDLWLVHIEQHGQALSDWRDKNNNDEKETNV